MEIAPPEFAAEATGELAIFHPQKLYATPEQKGKYAYIYIYTYILHIYIICVAYMYLRYMYACILHIQI